jgi:hypothetical protein
MGNKNISLSGDQGSFLKSKQDYISITNGVDYEPSLTISISESLPICSGTPLEFTAISENIGTGTIEWFVDDSKVGTGSPFTLPNITAEVNVVGKVTSNNICAINQSEFSSNEITVDVDLCTGIKVIESNLSVYPNPTSGIIFLEADNVESVLVTNLVGSVVLTKNKSKIIDLTYLSRGIYTLSVKTTDGFLFKQILKK